MTDWMNAVGKEIEKLRESSGYLDGYMGSMEDEIKAQNAEITRLQAIVDKQNEWLRYLPDHILERATEDVAALKEQPQ